MKTPNEEKYCPICKKMNTFNYNPYIGHAECKDCGSRGEMREFIEGLKDESRRKN